MSVPPDDQLRLGTDRWIKRGAEDVDKARLLDVAHITAYAMIRRGNLRARVVIQRERPVRLSKKAQAAFPAGGRWPPPAGEAAKGGSHGDRESYRRCGP